MQLMNRQPAQLCDTTYGANSLDELFLSISVLRTRFYFPDRLQKTIFPSLFCFCCCCFFHLLIYFVILSIFTQIVVM